MKAIMPYDRDEHGELAVYDPHLGRHRFMTAGEREERRQRREMEAPTPAAALPTTPHPHNVNRVSYGRSDGTHNWPSTW